MARSMLLFLFLSCAFSLLASMASAKVVKHSFHVGNMTVNPLCKEEVIVAVNKRLPGPIIRVHDGDTLIVHVFNESPYNITIHWHGIFQILSGWADGPSYVTQCPIPPGSSYTYKFNITRQEGTLWWHAHVSWLRSTVYGALIIRPKSGQFPFPKPHKEVPILLGEWWNANVIDVENEALASGGAPNISDAFTINGKPGDHYSCDTKKTFKLKVAHGKTYLLRIINAALNNQLFFKIANHNMTVVAVDASYTNPFPTDVVVVAPGQTTDVLLTADQPSGRYYMAARPYLSAPSVAADNTTTTGILEYEGSTSSGTPLFPALPALNDTPTAHHFYSNLTGLLHKAPKFVPRRVDEKMFITSGLGLEPCGNNATCPGPLGMRLAASMNNVSFQFPTRLSMLQAHFSGVQGIFTENFPNNPPLVFNYTDPSLAVSVPLAVPVKGTRVKRLAYNTTVEIVIQDTSFLAVENHPIHLHGFNFFVVAQGFGNFDRARDERKFNLVNPQVRNTIAVPVGGWAVIRFKANNPGVWLMHCHLDVHLPWGLATAFLIENGPTPSSTLPPPPLDLPRC
ncbi:laccase 7 [Tasmannia lanceolata]|uniref:laccase 7 n=1 Tax=Tasmannia lanceolata TaxID=3420 RepID=UPI00406442BC